MRSESDFPTVLDDPRDDLSENDREVVEDVEQYGFYWISVGQSEEDAVDFPEWQDVPNWSYTIGLQSSYGHPEIVVFELDDETVESLFWDLAREIQGGRTFEPGTMYKELPSFEDHSFAFEAVSPKWIPSLFGYGRWFYKGADFPVLQYLWPDRNGRFIWDRDAAPTLRDVQRDLASPPPMESSPRLGEAGNQTARPPETPIPSFGVG